MNFRAFLPVIAAAVTLALPATSQAGRHGHDHGHGHGHYNGHGHGHYGGYYGRSYGYGYGYGGYGYGYPYYGPTIGLSFYSRPRYDTYYSSRVYRGSVASNSLAFDVQRALKSRGYYYGSVDGLIGSGSRAAIRAYQRDRGLSITGRIDRELLRSLRIG